MPTNDYGQPAQPLCDFCWSHAKEVPATRIAVLLGDDEWPNLCEPCYNAIVWQDRRTADFCDALRKKGKDKFIQQKTGLVIDAYFSATKVKWILDNVDGARTKSNNGNEPFSTES